MRILGPRAFRSKVARRTIVLFVVCALIPVSVLAALALGQVTAQLKEQSERRLQQASKAVAMVLYRRLVTLETEMSARASGEGARFGLISPSPATKGDGEVYQPLMSLVRVTRDGRLVPLVGRIDNLPALGVRERQHLASGKTLLSVRRVADGGLRLLVARARGGDEPGGGILWGEVSPAYLWGFEDEPALPSGTTLAVLDSSRDVLFSSLQAAPPIPEEVAIQMYRGILGQFEWKDATDEYVASYWSLFLQYRFATPKWTIVLSQSKADIFAPIAVFKRTFFLVVVTTVWIITLLSIRQIRKSLIPLAKLQEGTRRIAEGDFASRVEVTSRDEFEDLAASFNRMGSQLGRQFGALTIRNEISSALNRDKKLEAILRQCVEILTRHLNLALACIWTLSGDEGTLELVAAAGSSQRLDAAHRRIRLGESEIGRIAVERQPYATNAVLDDPRVSDREWARRAGIVAFAGHPLMVEGRLVGVTAVFAREPLDAADLSGIASVAGEIAQCIERKRVEEALQGSEAQVRHLQKVEAMGRLAGGITHDFNNLLTVIIGQSQLLLRRLPPGNPARAGLDLIETTAGRAAGLTRQLLAFSRKQVLAPSVLDLNDAVAGMTEMLQRLIGENIELRFAAGEELGRVKVDVGQLEQAVVNLIVNARDAMPDGGRITIETANVELWEPNARHHPGVIQGSYAMLAVSDTGTGMDAETRSHLFEPFYTTKAPGKGTGLGLATVYGIVKQSGGNVWVDSERGKGSTFKIYLPRVMEAPETETDAGPPPARGTETILVVEDEDAVRALAQRALEDYGYHVLSAGKISEALQIAQDHAGPVDLLVTDMVMPKMSGSELAERLVALRHEMAVLYMSGYADHAAVDHDRLAAGTPFLQKPFTAEALARHVRAALDSRRRTMQEPTSPLTEGSVEPPQMPRARGTR